MNKTQFQEETLAPTDPKETSKDNLPKRLFEFFGLVVDELVDGQIIQEARAGAACREEEIESLIIKRDSISN